MESVGQPNSAKTLATRCFGVRVVTRDEDAVLTWYPAGVDHHLVVHRVERLHDTGARERALDLFSETVSVRERECGRQTGREIKREGQVQKNLARKVVSTYIPERF